MCTLRMCRLKRCASREREGMDSDYPANPATARRLTARAMAMKELKRLARLSPRKIILARERPWTWLCRWACGHLAGQLMAHRSQKEGQIVRMVGGFIDHFFNIVQRPERRVHLLAQSPEELFCALPVERVQLPQPLLVPTYTRIITQCASWHRAQRGAAHQAAHCAMWGH